MYKKVLILGSGALKIGEAGEFDYSGSQAIKALKEEGVKTVLVNPNIATVQTDPGFADQLYLLPVTPEYVEQVIERERPDGIMLAFGGQTALNCGLELEERGILTKYGVSVLGTPPETIRLTEDREAFNKVLDEVDVKYAKSGIARNTQEAIQVASQIGYPVLVRSAFALGGLGSGFAHSETELIPLVEKSFAYSDQVIIDESLVGWKELEYEVVRDSNDSVITVCNMENIDPMGIHTGESIVVAPSQTLSDHDHQMLRDLALRVIRRLGILGECNIQFALDPASDRYSVIEVNARLSRSSALASKVTGYPLAYVAAKIALGHTLDTIRNQVTAVTTAFFEPSLDYVVVKVPRWDLEKFEKVDQSIGSEMKSVGEVMAIGRSIEEALQKAFRNLDIGALGLVGNSHDFDFRENDLDRPTPKRMFAIVRALLHGKSVREIHEKTHIDPFFLEKLHTITDTFSLLQREKNTPLSEHHIPLFIQAKKQGFSDRQIAKILGKEEEEIYRFRNQYGILPKVNRIDTLAGEFPAKTNYCYMTYHGAFSDQHSAVSNIPPQYEGVVPLCGIGGVYKHSAINSQQSAMSDERSIMKKDYEGGIIDDNSLFGEIPPQYEGVVPLCGIGGVACPVPERCLSHGHLSPRPSLLEGEREMRSVPYFPPSPCRRGIEGEVSAESSQKVLVLGSGAYRIGSSVEFDWCSVSALSTLKKLGYETIMLNFNPETVSTDFDSSDILYFEEINLETIREIYIRERPIGVIIAMGGQIANNLATILKRAGIPILGTNPDDIDRAENRHVFSSLLDSMEVEQPLWAELTTPLEALDFAEKHGYPVIIRPSYVLSGANMQICSDRVQLENFFHKAIISSEHPTVISKFEVGAKEIEIDGVAKDGVLELYAISEHIENAGVHSGDATVLFPAQTLHIETIHRTKKIAKQITRALGITGPFNIQFLAKNDDIKVIECNLRASRSFPFVSKVSGYNFIEIATRAIMGHDIHARYNTLDLDHIGVKASQSSFHRLKGADPRLGIEMASTGEVGCIGENVHEALMLAMNATGIALEGKNILVTLGPLADKVDFLSSARTLQSLGYILYTTHGTHNIFMQEGIETILVPKQDKHGKNPILAMIDRREFALVINSPSDHLREEEKSGYLIRRQSVDRKIPLITNVKLAKFFVRSLAHEQKVGGYRGQAYSELIETPPTKPL